VHREPSELTFTLHGLDRDGKLVRADVFARKLATLVRAVSAADRAKNHKARNKYLVGNLQCGSANALLKEAPIKANYYGFSGIEEFGDTLQAVYSGNSPRASASPKVVDLIHRLAIGCGREYAHAEIQIEHAEPVRVDDFLEHQARAAITSIEAPVSMGMPTWHKGESITEFDGSLEEMDIRGRIWRGKLVLTAGRKEIDCVVDGVELKELREKFGRRAFVRGTAYYDGIHPLPIRLHVKQLAVMSNGRELRYWRGAFNFPEEETVDIDW
jgi:hypothetical protein